MPFELRFNVPSLIILIGIVLGFLLSVFFIKSSINKKRANIFMGLLILTFTFNMLEGWLNYTGLIFKVLHLSNFSEPTNFVIAPLLYFFVIRQLGEKSKRWDIAHYFPFLFWLLYCIFFFTQSAEFKYNSNIFALGLDLEPLQIDYTKANDNPLGIRNFVNELTIFHLVIYSIVILYKVWQKSKEIGESLFTTSNLTLKSLRSSIFHFITLLVLLIFVKALFKDDVGDYILYVYLSFLLLFNIAQVMNSSSYFDVPSSFLEFPKIKKYKNSSLTIKKQKDILNKIDTIMIEDLYFKNPLASLSNLSKKIKESTHHVSQSLNEGRGQSFFELLAYHRIEEAKKILSSEDGQKLTVEEVAEMVGYNSKSSFNTSFKKLTLKTPSQFRNTHNSTPR